MDKITALEIRQQVMNSEKPQRALGRVLDKIVEDFAESPELRGELYDVIEEYARQKQRLSIQKEIEHLRSELCRL